MGLDMYLTARRAVAEPERRQAILAAVADIPTYEEEVGVYLSRWRHDEERERARTDEILDLAGLTPMIGAESNYGHAYPAPDGSLEVEVAATYWRKANAVHGWFVENIQEGNDDCGTYEVQAEQLAALRAACSKALAAYVAGDLEAARKAMEPTPGFFFGSTETDVWWAETLATTVTEVERIVRAAIEIGGVRFFYRSSW